MRRQLVAIIIALVAVGCDRSTGPSTRYVPEQEAQLISIAREAAQAEGRSLSDAIYSVRRDGIGWVVQVDRSPGYTGSGETRITCCASFFVRLTSDGRATEIFGPGLRQTKISTPPTRGA